MTLGETVAQAESESYQVDERQPITLSRKVFNPDAQPWPDGIIELEPTGDYYVDDDKYAMMGPDGLLLYVRPGDVVETVLYASAYRVVPNCVVDGV